MTDLIQSITSDLFQKIENYKPSFEVKNVGVVLTAGDGIAEANGLADVRSQELVEFENGVMGIAFNLEREKVGIIILGDYSGIHEGMQVSTTGRIASVPVGDGLVGRVVNALGEPIDGKGMINYSRFRPIERVAAGVVERQDVDTPVQTGIIAIDTMFPIGRGQRELIIGDRQTGKTALAVDAILNQTGKDLICIYVAIGQKKSAIARMVSLLEKEGALNHTVIVVASADESATMQYIAPYAGCAIGEEFMESGRDALIIYDDLSKHAWAYRQVSLLLRRPPGREAYPGDVFYLHSRLLERAVRLADQYVIVPRSYSHAQAQIADSVDGVVFGGPRSEHDAAKACEEKVDNDSLKVVKVQGSGGSLTALPIIETLLGDFSAYVPTNVISITDGQIYLETNLFNAGIRPAINVGMSVSRVGGAAQTKAIRQVASRLKLDMATYRALAAFAQFGSDLDKLTLAQLNRGQRLQELLKQAQYQPQSLEDQVMIMFAGTNGFLDQIGLDKVRAWQTSFLKYAATSYPEVGKDIAARKQITKETESRLRLAIQTFNSTWIS